MRIEKTVGEWVSHCDIDCGLGVFHFDCPACKEGGSLYDVWDEKYARICFKCEKCETALESDWDSDEMEQWVIAKVYQITKPFNLTVSDRINAEPEFRREMLKQVIELVSSNDLKVAQIILSQVIEADEGVDE